MEPELKGDEQPPQDPLLKSGAFIDASRDNNTESPKKTKEGASSSPASESVHTTPLIDSSNATYVTPLSQWKPDAQPRQEASAERPDWLPGDWGYERKVRTSGATAGIVDRYFISPAGTRFRSKTEVLHFLKHGTKRKKTESGSASTSAAAAASPAQKKEKKPKRGGASKKGKENGKDFSNLTFDFTNPPQSVTWVPKDESENKWTPLVGNVAVPEAEKAEWSEALNRVTEAKKEE